ASFSDAAVPAEPAAPPLPAPLPPLPGEPRLPAIPPSGAATVPPVPADPLVRSGETPLVPQAAAATETQKLAMRRSLLIIIARHGEALAAGQPDNVGPREDGKRRSRGASEMSGNFREFPVALGSGLLEDRPAA